MALERVTSLGPYEILAVLGRGGIGQVSRACDSKLDREVAIKVLPTDFANGPERLARFEREAKSLAALSYHYVVSLHGSEPEGGTHWRSEFGELRCRSPRWPPSGSRPKPWSTIIVTASCTETSRETRGTRGELGQGARAERATP